VLVDAVKTDSTEQGIEQIATALSQMEHVTQSAAAMRSRALPQESN